ncbi:hypothetical protein FC56_GL001503 [Lentilactobacillus senioris DSM 24302 = JCM 17472]|uniref:Uncharacterized protein n=1 Tax=Lentilactobacillus senioris DSM 24302 = JCM 17472 TaxID=1423802 RepID=A0A0R2CRV5_9LACO|nr:hypothetical protein [Lentilactobacillus senioris]KRM94545.1 hypothetical protein FC56_GL001503 [Lentilactobacillus senioris DSM 24302 = JCM 17472]
MKKWIWLVVAIIVGLAVGGYSYARHAENQKLYEDAIEQGNLQISNKKYTAAETEFMNALKKKPGDKRANVLLKQTQEYAAGDSSFAARQYPDAKTSYTQVTNTKGGNQQLVDRAKDQLSLIKKIQTNLAKYTKVYNKALQQQKAGQYVDSNITLNEILTDKNASQSYYKTIFNKAKKLRDSNNSAIENNSIPTDPNEADNFEQPSNDPVDNPNVAANSTSSSSASSDTASTSESKDSAVSSSSSSASLTSSEKKAADNYKGSNEYTVPDSKKKINGKDATAMQIKEARATIKAAGVDEGALSDQDIIDAINGALKKNESLAQYAKENF